VELRETSVRRIPIFRVQPTLKTIGRWNLAKAKAQAITAGEQLRRLLRRSAESLEGVRGHVVEEDQTVELPLQLAQGVFFG